MNLLRSLSLLSLAAVTLCSCSTPVEAPKGTSAGYMSARFVQATSRDRYASPNALEEDPAFNAQIKAAISQQFKAKGIAFGNPQAQLIVAYMLIRQNSVATTMNRDYFGNGRDAMAILAEAHQRGVVKNTRVDDFVNGAIVIDILDARTNKLIFRNYAVRPVTAGADAATRQSKINSAVAQALAPFFKN